MDLYRQVERTRHLGNEFLLFLWFESEVLDATLRTKKHGHFGMWVEKELSLVAESESTKIKGALPGRAREAKEGLLLGKMPEKAGFRLILGEREASFSLRGDSLALSAVVVPTVLEEEAPIGLDEIGPPKGGKKRGGGGGPVDDEERVAIEEQESFYERMQLLREVEEIVEALYADFLVLRLGPAYEKLVAPALLAWARGTDIDGDKYAEVRAIALGHKKV